MKARTHHQLRAIFAKLKIMASGGSYRRGRMIPPLIVPNPVAVAPILTAGLNAVRRLRKNRKKRKTRKTQTTITGVRQGV